MWPTHTPPQQNHTLDHNIHIKHANYCASSLPLGGVHHSCCICAEASVAGVARGLLARGCDKPTFFLNYRPTAIDMAVCGFCRCGCGKRTRRTLPSGEFDAHKKRVWNGSGAPARFSLRKARAKLPALQAKVITDARLSELRHHNQRLVSENRKLQARVMVLEEMQATLTTENAKLLQEVTITRCALCGPTALQTVWKPIWCRPGV